MTIKYSDLTHSRKKKSCEVTGTITVIYRDEIKTLLHYRKHHKF